MFHVKLRWSRWGLWIRIHFFQIRIQLFSQCGSRYSCFLMRIRTQLIGKRQKILLKSKLPWSWSKFSCIFSLKFFQISGFFRIDPDPQPYPQVRLHNMTSYLPLGVFSICSILATFLMGMGSEEVLDSSDSAKEGIGFSFLQNTHQACVATSLPVMFPCVLEMVPIRD